MKHTLSLIIYSIGTIGTLLLSTPVQAVTPTQALTPTTSKKQATPSAIPEENLLDKLQQIKKLKEKIATKVAELREKEKAAIAGTVKKMSASSITIASLKGERTVSFSDDVQVFTMSNKGKAESTVKKIQENDVVAAIGYLDENKQTLVASYVYIQSATQKRMVGKIADIDKDNFTVTVKTKGGQTIVDIEKYTKMSAYDKKTGTFQKIGFSRLAIGETVHVAATPNAKDDTRVSALRMYTLAFTPSTETEPTETKSATPSSITPSKKASPPPTGNAVPTTKPSVTKAPVASPSPKP